MKNAIVYTVIGVALLAALGTVGKQDVEAEQQEQQIQYLQEAQMRQEGQQLKESRAFTICDKAHDELSGESEEACGKALDEAGVTFQCEYPNTAESRCWIEAL